MAADPRPPYMEQSNKPGRPAWCKAGRSLAARDTSAPIVVPLLSICVESCFGLYVLPKHLGDILATR